MAHLSGSCSGCSYISEDSIALKVTPLQVNFAAVTRHIQHVDPRRIAADKVGTIMETVVSATR